MILRILKQSGENSVQVSDRVRQTLSELEQGEGLGLRFHALTDQADLVGASLSNLTSSIVIGAILAVAVLLLFLKSAASIAVIGLAVPLSIAGALVIMYALGTGLNMMSLGGLALAVGMLVDNAIVVLENIFRLRQEGKESLEAATIGGGQIASAIVASTLTTLVVFVPIFFIKSWAGILFRDTGNRGLSFVDRFVSRRARRGAGGRVEMASATPTVAEGARNPSRRRPSKRFSSL